MKLRIKLIVVFFSLFTIVVHAQQFSGPHLENKGNTKQLIVNGKPFLVLGGELHNSSGSGMAYLTPLLEQLKRKNLNTVITPVYWELFEPKEGVFDYTLIDNTIKAARNNGLHLVFLWFGSWKNGYSMYAPGWVKNNPERFPRAKDKDGNSYEMLSALNQESRNADAKAFKALMHHIKEIDAKYQTVIAMQIENEVGLFYSPRDYGNAANAAYDRGVPQNLLRYLSDHKGRIHPVLDSAWKANGYKTSGSWEDVFGKSKFDKDNLAVYSYLPEELFSVYHYSQYIGAIAGAGKSEYPIPMYVNCWIRQPHAPFPGKYPSGGPTPHTIDIWRANAPSLDFISPDIYVPQKFARLTMELYHLPGNPLFIPEFRRGAQSAREAFWAYGTLDAICFSPFGVEDGLLGQDDITQTYGVLKKASEQILENRGKGTMMGIYLDSANRAQSFDLNGYHITAQFGGAYISELGAIKPRKTQFAGGIIIANGPDEFIVIGKDLNIRLQPLHPDVNKPLYDVDFFEEGYFNNRKWVATRRLNGDEGTGGGDYGYGSGSNKMIPMIRLQLQKDNNYSLVRFKLSRYN
jgi:hypothetical protein